MNFVLIILYSIMFWVLGLLLGVGGSLFALFVPGLRDYVSRYFERATATTLHRPAITFGESSDLLLKRRDYDADQGAEVISSGDDQLETANPDNAIWSWHGTPLSITDEFFGVNIDQRHVHPGEVLREHIRENTLWVGDFWSWLNGEGILAAPAVAPVEKDGSPGALQAARALFWGGEEADHPDTVKTFVAKAHEGRNDTAVWKQLLVPAAFLVIGFGLMWLGAKYNPTGGGGGGQAQPVGGASLALLLGLPDVRGRLRDAWSRLQGGDGDDVDDSGVEDVEVERPREDEFGDRDAVIEMDEQTEESQDEESGQAGGSGDDGPGIWENMKSRLPSLRQVGVGIAAVLGLGVLAVVLFFMHAFFGPLGMAAVLFSFACGFAVFPFSGPILSKRMPTSFAERLARVYLRLGLLPYKHPDLELGADGQRFVEGDGSGQRYRLAGKHVGLTLDEDDLKELYGNRAERAGKIEARAVSDGGEVEGVPKDYAEVEGLTFDRVKGYVPEDPDTDHIYARLDRVMAPFQKANIGSRSKKALENAKEEYGAGWRELDIRQIIWASIGCALLGLLTGYLVFFGVPL